MRILRACIWHEWNLEQRLGSDLQMPDWRSMPSTIVQSAEMARRLNRAARVQTPPSLDPRDISSRSNIQKISPSAQYSRVQALATWRKAQSVNWYATGLELTVNIQIKWYICSGQRSSCCNIHDRRFPSPSIGYASHG